MPDLIPREFAPLLTDSSGTHEWVQAMTVALQSNEFANTWSQDAGSACRGIFTFANGWRLTWAGDGNGGFPDLLQAWHVDGTTDGALGDLAARFEFEWDDEFQAYARNTSETTAITDVISGFVSEFGPCFLVLPWDSFINTEMPEELLSMLPGTAPFLEELAALSEDDTQSLLDMTDEVDEEPPLFGVLAALSRESLLVPKEWSIGPAVCDMGDTHLIPGSPLDRFYQFVGRVEDLDDWVVIWNECCGTCSRSSYEWAVASKGLADGAPSLILFGQNAQYSWRPDCTLETDFYQASADEVEVLAALAREEGLSVLVPNGDPSRLLLS